MNEAGFEKKDSENAMRMGRSWIAAALFAILVSCIGSDPSVAQGGDSSGTLMSWGYNRFGELGNGQTSFSQSSPGEVSNLSGVSRVDSGRSHSIALRSDGTVWTWGFNSSAQSGDGTYDTHRTPVQTPKLSHVVKVAAGGSHNLVLKSDGNVWGAGRNYTGQVGDGTFGGTGTDVDRQRFVKTVGISGVSDISAGSSFSLALKKDGTVWGWGWNVDSQLGDGTSDDDSDLPRVEPRPVRTVGLSSVKEIAAGADHGLALKKDGTVWGWGANVHGEVGDGTYVERDVPVRVPGLSGVVAIAAGNDHSLALKSDGTVWAWGLDTSDQIDGGILDDTPTPIQISEVSGVRFISAGDTHDLAVKEDGTVYAWGSDFYGQLGDGPNTSYDGPLTIPNLSGVTAVATGSQHSIACVGGVPLKDLTGPTLSGMSPKAGSKSGDRTPTIKATIKDDVTDLRESDVKLSVKGKAIKASKFSYSAKTNGLVYKSPQLRPGQVPVKIVAKDAAGNTGTKSWSFTIKK